MEVTVSGGKETSPLWTSQISDKDFGQALRDSLLQSSVFARVSDAADARYRLDAFFARLNQPVMGFSITVEMEVTYTLTDKQTQRRVWQKAISTSQTVTVSESPIGVMRLQRANEGAARKNVEQLIEEISRLQLA